MRYDKQIIQGKLRVSQRWRAKTLLMLYNEQSITEKTMKETLHSNDTGFTGPDAPVLTRYAESVSKGRGLSRNMDLLLQKRLPKYWRQVVEAIAKAQRARLIKAGKSFVEIRS